MPAGYVAGLPVGVSFIGGSAFSEPQLLALAYAWEQATDIRVPPTFPDSVELEALPPPRKAPRPPRRRRQRRRTGSETIDCYGSFSKISACSGPKEKTSHSTSSLG